MELSEKKIYSVIEINQKIKSLIESDFSFIGINVKGEITSLKKHYTGHYYFKLRGEDESIISCVMFSSYIKFAPLDLKDGDEVIVTGSISLYDKGGTYSLNARKIEPYGLGAYLIKLKLLEDKLKKEGLFDRVKRPIPLLPHRIGVLTAKTGAAIHDVVSSIQKNCHTEIYIFPCSVQGKDAPQSMIKALNKAYSFDLDLIILTRGGGSKDDLYAFNDEELVRTLFNSPFPTITAVGHSIDSSLVDKISDYSCITPTDAGNKAIGKKENLKETIENKYIRVKNLIDNKLKDLENNLLNLITRLDILSPIKKYKDYQNKLAMLNNKMDLLMKSILNKYRLKLDSLKLKDPLTRRVKMLKYKLNEANKSFDKNIIYILNKYKTNLDNYAHRIEIFSPFSLLSKGYVLLYNENGKLVTSVENIKKEEILSLDLKDGEVLTKVIEIKEKQNGK